MLCSVPGMLLRRCPLPATHLQLANARRLASSYSGGKRRRRSSGSTVPLAVPFANYNHAVVREHFRMWANSSNRWTFDASAIQLATPQPVYLPFFAFNAAIDVEFDGSLGYTTTHSTYDKDGRRRTHTTTNWYSKSGIRIPRHQLGPSVSDPYMLQYAGFEFRRSYIDESTANMMRDFSTVLDAATPMRAGMLPGRCAVHGFECKPSYAYGLAMLGIESKASYLAHQYLRRSDLEDTFEADNFIGGLFGSTACRLTDWEQPDRFHVGSTSFTVHNERLHTCGAVFLPFWICEYKLHGKKYRAFLNDAAMEGSSARHGRVVGPSHVDFRTMQVSGAVGGGTIALAAAAISKAPLALVVAPLFSIAGYFIATWRAATHEQAWDSAGLRRQQEREFNDSWQTQAYWQQQMRQFAIEWQQRERDSFEREKASRQSTESEQPSPEHRESIPEWRHMSDYEILGLERSDFETETRSYIGMKRMKSKIAGAFRAQAMIWHPDRNEGKSPEWYKQCQERFKRIVQAHQNLRKRWSGERRSM